MTENRKGKNHTIGGMVDSLRREFIESATPERRKAILDKLYEQATAGDYAAIKIILERLLGPATAFDIVERKHDLKTIERVEALDEDNNSQIPTLFLGTGRKTKKSNS